MKRSIGIIGTGAVGTSIAISILHTGIADELLFWNRNMDHAEGEAMDLAHGASWYSTTSINVTTIEKMKSADIIVIAAGKAQQPGESRLDLIKENAKIIHHIGAQLTDYQGIIVVVTNPVDILTKVLMSSSGLPATRVIGTGTMLDTARLKHGLGKILNIDPHSVHAQVIGEHGDSEVILWSSVRIGGLALDNLPHWDWHLKEKIENDVKLAAYRIIQKKGATNHAVGLASANLLKCILRNEHRVLTVSHNQDCINNHKGVTLSLPSVVGEDGILEVLMPKMSTDEEDNLMHSAKIINAAYEEIMDVI
jgi:L-lactate dehydrogenase